jgi:hypothetical protein
LQFLSSSDITLADEDIKMLERWGVKFRAANANRREKMIEDAADRIERTWTEDAEFDRGKVITVRRLSTRLG